MQPSNRQLTVKRGQGQDVDNREVDVDQRRKLEQACSTRGRGAVLSFETDAGSLIDASAPAHHPTHESTAVGLLPCCNLLPSS